MASKTRKYMTLYGGTAGRRRRQVSSLGGVVYPASTLYVTRTVKRYVRNVCNTVTGTIYKATHVDKTREDTLWVYEQLCLELTQAQEDYKRMRYIVDQLRREYYDSKEVDYFRRYNMMKGMIKRSVMHVKLKEDYIPLPGSDVRQKEEWRKRELQIQGMSPQEIAEENDYLTDQIREYKRKSTLIKDLIGQMERSYSSSKQYFVIQRYRILKAIIKSVIHNNWI